ncbi:MAG: fumarylacetoacetate hydrolase family protein [Bacteroidia bacterium]|nr:fumarylacetoacetate hydrolase family protein [Bacteroidia bacterium]
MKIICIGRNYADHAKELNNDLPEEPVFFMKPDTALLRNNDPFFLPDFSQDVHHEIELVLRICKAGKHIEPEFASAYYNEITAGIDFTARDVQQQLKQKGLPWEKAKAFDGSAVTGTFLPFAAMPENIAFSLEKNGQTVQSGLSSDMIFSFNEIISFVSRFVTLKVGDLVYTGTPAGVSAVQIGDTLAGKLGSTEVFRFAVR